MLSCVVEEHAHGPEEVQKNGSPPGEAVAVRRRSSEVDKPLIKASHVSFYSSEIKKLEQMAQRDGKARTQVIREAVKRFLNRRTFERNTFNFDAHSPKGIKRIYPSFSKSDWDILNEVSKKTNRFRTELVGEAVVDYLKNQKS